MTEPMEQPIVPELPETRQPSQAEIDAIHLKIQKQGTHSSGAGWFYWIAGLSLITSIISLSGGSWSFLAGLGITQVFDGFAIGLEKSGSNSLIKVFAFFLDVLAATFFIVVGIFAKKGKKPAYIIGGVLYVIDTVILLAFTEWFGAAFHAFALFQIWTGYKALCWLESQTTTIPEAEPVVATSEAAEPA